FLSSTQSYALDTPCWAPLTASISLDEFLDFTSGYEDPQFTIPLWNLPHQQCAQHQARPSSSSGSRSNSAQEPDVYGSCSINWDFTLYPTADTSDLSNEATSLPLSDSPSTALTSTLTSPGLSLNDSADWNAFALATPGALQYLGNDSQLLMGGSNPFTTSDQSLNIMAVATVGLQDASISAPMVKDISSSGSSTSLGVSPSPEQSSASRQAKASPLAPEVSKIEKRRANTMAARRYRQKRVDQMTTLESELKEIKTERDDLKVRCARLEGEVETLRALLHARQ
ncbi:hypothetical protein EK21DRAFT_74376, partial [Setomelanomma holmii]